MPDYPDPMAAQLLWRALPVPTEDLSRQCHVAPIRITFKAVPGDTAGFLLEPGEAIPIRSGQAGFIKPTTALGGIFSIESIG